jgi:hypothetical protein
MALLMAFNTHYNVLGVVGATTTQTSSDYSNEWARGAKIYINMSSAGTGSVAVTLQGKDQSSGQYYTILASPNIVANGFSVLSVYPGAAVTANVSANDVMPLKFRVLVTANNANPTSYTVGVDLVV